jgi:cytochrome c oxidase cbb3-type subunit 2
MRSRSERGAAGAAVIAVGTVFCLALGFYVAVWLPIGDAANRAGAAGEPRSYDQRALTGRALYIREGCFSCHTQQVRDSFSDSALGPGPSLPGLYNNEAPNLIGTIRLGPDLTCFGDRAANAASIVQHLRNPQAAHHESTMPRYGYLDTKELQALAAYLLRLRCEEG